MDNKIVETYLKYLGNVRDNSNYSPSVEENTAIYNITHDPKYADLISQLKNVKDYDNQKKIITGYLAEQEIKNAKDPKDLVSKIYGVNVEDVENVKLDNNVEVFAFYDVKLGRKRLIENLGKDSLVAQLKEMQNENLEFQTSDFKKNSDDMLKNKAEENNNRQELKMVEINDYINHPENYGTIDEDTQEIISKIIKEKDSLKIKYINIQNKVALTEDQRIIEISKTKEGKFVFNEPKKWKNNTDEISNEEKVKENETITSSTEEKEDNYIEENKFEDETEFISAKEIEEELQIANIETDASVQEIKDNIKNLYDNPEAIDKIENPMEKAFYSKMVNEVFAVRKADFEKKNEMKRTMVYKNQELNNNGFVNLIFVTILLLFLAFVLFIGF